MIVHLAHCVSNLRLGSSSGIPNLTYFIETTLYVRFGFSWYVFEKSNAWVLFYFFPIFFFFFLPPILSFIHRFFATGCLVVLLHFYFYNFSRIWAQMCWSAWTSPQPNWTTRWSQRKTMIPTATIPNITRSTFPPMWGSWAFSSQQRAPPDIWPYRIFGTTGYLAAFFLSQTRGTHCSRFLNVIPAILMERWAGVETVFGYQITSSDHSPRRNSTDLIWWIRVIFKQNRLKYCAPWNTKISKLFAFEWSKLSPESLLQGRLSPPLGIEGVFPPVRQKDVRDSQKSYPGTQD